MPLEDSQAYAYLPVPDIVTRLGLYVTGAGSAVVPANSAYPHQQHPELYDFSWKAGRTLPEFQFVFISQGKGEFESQETGLQPVMAGTVIQLFPDVWHRYRPDRETGWTEHWVSIGGELMFQWHQRGILNKNRPLARLRNPQHALNQYSKIIRGINSEIKQNAVVMASLAMSAVTAALDCFENSEGDSHSDTIGESESFSPATNNLSDSVIKARTMIWNHSHQRLSVEMIAKEIGISRRTLERHFGEQTGSTVLQEILSCRIARAKRMLAETNVPIKYVAHSAGFTSVSNLCKVFRRELDLTPGEYRVNARV